MRTATIVWLLIAAFLVVAGISLLAVTMWQCGWDFTKLSTGEYETNTYEISEPFHNLSLDTETADIAFRLSQDGKCKVECYEDSRAKHSVAVKENTLLVQFVDQRKWYERIGINLHTTKITLYLPSEEYTGLLVKESTGDIEIPKDFTFRNIDVSTDTGAIAVSASTTGPMILKTGTGAITLKDLSAGTMKLSVSTGLITVYGAACHGEIDIRVSTGKTNLTDVVCEKLVSVGDTGDIVLNQVIAEGLISIERSTGDVRFNSSDALGISVETDTGDVTGSLLTGKCFVVETDTGRVDVPRGMEGGRCMITTDTGDIKISISE